MPVLKSEPHAAVQSMEELFAIAAAMELEAATRYAEIADRLDGEGQPDLAGLFRRLAEDEQGHLDSVGHWSERARGAPPDLSLIRWKLPETFDDEGAATANPRLLTAYRSLAMAVRNEERAFAFWSYVAAQADEPDIQHAAETMAHEELGHVAALRRERRRMFHRERSWSVQDGRDDAAFGALEHRLAAALEALASGAEPAEAARLGGLAEEGRRLAKQLEDEPIPVPRSVGPVEGSPADSAALSELLVDLYLGAAESASEEAVRARAQAFAGQAIRRLAALRRDLPEVVTPR